MRWQGRRESDRVEDRRGQGTRRGGLSLGLGGLLLVVVFAFLTGRNPIALLEMVGQGTPAPAPAGPAPGSAPAADDPTKKFVSVVLADTEQTWTEVFARQGHAYELPALVLFTDSTQSGCGAGEAAGGPFYCPADRKVYLDLSFFRELDQRFGAPGDFAQAYVVAHEVGHHVQQLLGISDKVSQLQARSSRERANDLSVRLELQADCFAGVWGRHAATRQLLEPGDVEEGLQAAAAIGDDTLQREAGRHPRPETFTHGSSEQRARWFRKGLETGDPSACSTFEGTRL